MQTDNPTTTTDKTPLESLCAGVLPHIAERIKRAYWIGAAEGAEAMAEARRQRDKAELFGLQDAG